LESLLLFRQRQIGYPLNGFTKKTQKTLKKEIDKATRLMTEYYEAKKE